MQLRFGGFGPRSPKKTPETIVTFLYQVIPGHSYHLILNKIVVNPRTCVIPKRVSREKFPAIPFNYPCSLCNLTLIVRRPSRSRRIQISEEYLPRRQAPRYILFQLCRTLKMISVNSLPFPPIPAPLEVSFKFHSMAQGRFLR